MGPVMGCAVDGCAGETWPGEDWVIFDTPVGSFEVLLCDAHYEAHQRGELQLATSWARYIEIIMDNPVVHA